MRLGAISRRNTILIALFAALFGCVEQNPVPRTAESVRNSGSSMSSLMFLTRDGCVNTPKMRSHLDQAIQSLGSSLSYEIVDQGSLLSNDAGRGYPTPTLLLNGRDLFGLPEPTQPFPGPT